MKCIKRLVGEIGCPTTGMARFLKNWGSQNNQLHTYCLHCLLFCFVRAVGIPFFVVAVHDGPPVGTVGLEYRNANGSIVAPDVATGGRTEPSLELGDLLGEVFGAV